MTSAVFSYCKQQKLGMEAWEWGYVSVCVCGCEYVCVLVWCVHVRLYGCSCQFTVYVYQCKLHQVWWCHSGCHTSRKVGQGWAGRRSRVGLGGCSPSQIHGGGGGDLAPSLHASMGHKAWTTTTPSILVTWSSVLFSCCSHLLGLTTTAKRSFFRPQAPIILRTLRFIFEGRG